MSTTNKTATPATLACNETLKLCSCLLARYTFQTSRFTGTLEPLLSLLENVDICSPPLQPPVSLLISCLVSLKLDPELMFPSSNCTIHVVRPANYLTATIQEEDSENSKLDKILSPLLQLFLRIAEIATDTPKKRLQDIFLPSIRDRDRPLGEGSSLQAKLLGVSSVIENESLRQLVPALFFELSDQDPQRFVENVGYGYASGFLYTQGIPLPNSSSNRIIDEDSLEPTEINPVTGQRVDAESDSSVPMTDEEKEREAERLFVLFERSVAPFLLFPTFTNSSLLLSSLISHSPVLTKPNIACYGGDRCRESGPCGRKRRPTRVKLFKAV